MLDAAQVAYMAQAVLKQWDEIFSKIGLSYRGQTASGPAFAYYLADPFAYRVYKGLLKTRLSYVPPAPFSTGGVVYDKVDGRILEVSDEAQDLVGPYVLLNLMIGRQLPMAYSPQYSTNGLPSQEALIGPYKAQLEAAADRGALLQEVLDQLNAFVQNITGQLGGALKAAFLEEIELIKAKQDPPTAPPTTAEGTPVLIGWPDLWRYPGGSQFRWTRETPWTNEQVTNAYNALAKSILDGWGIDVTK